MQADYFRHRVLDFGWLMRSAIQSEGPMFQGHLTEILQRLARAGLVLSHHGVKGGYALARDPHQISVPT